LSFVSAGFSGFSSANATNSTFLLQKGTVARAGAFEFAAFDEEQPNA